MACGSWVVARQFLGWSPASSWAGRFFVTRLVLCKQAQPLWQGVQKLVLNRASRDTWDSCSTASGQRVPVIKIVEATTTQVLN